MLFIKLITLPGRVIIILHQDPSLSRFHQEPEPVNNRCCCWQQASGPISPTRVAPKYPGGFLSCCATSVSAMREEGYTAGHRYLRPRGRSRGKEPSALGNSVFVNNASRGVCFWNYNDFWVTDVLINNHRTISATTRDHDDGPDTGACWEISLKFKRYALIWK